MNTPPAEVGAIFEFARYDHAENKIYASYKEGVYVLNCALKSTNLVPVYPENEGFDILISGVVRWKNAYWLATNKGLIEYNPTTNSRNIYNRRNGIASNILFGILSSDNELWLATQNGLCQFNPYTLRSNNFYTQHGLINNEFNHWSYHKASDGHLFFGGPGGVIGFDPSKFEQQFDKKGQLHLTNITTFNERNEILRSLRKSPLPGEKIVIQPKEKNVSFKFSITLFDAIDQNQYDYFLNGLESDWINIGNMHEVRYSHPPPGKYTFRVRAKGPDNLPALNELAIPIHILQYWYLRWWAIAIYILFIGYCLWLLYHYQLR